MSPGPPAGNGRRGEGGNGAGRQRNALRHWQRKHVHAVVGEEGPRQVAIISYTHFLPGAASFLKTILPLYFALSLLVPSILVLTSPSPLTFQNVLMLPHSPLNFFHIQYRLTVLSYLSRNTAKLFQIPTLPNVESRASSFL